ncbi:MAG: type IV pilus secretin PilQ [Oligoflexia bacterium]|nr:type IV pilus secretin PilQ [Oligoflexia bacterium]
MKRSHSNKMTKQALAGSLASLFVLMNLYSVVAEAAGIKVTGIDFKGTSDPSEISITTEGGAVTVDKEVNAGDKQVILNISGATLSGPAKRNIDTSSFNGEVAMISPYQVTPGQPGVKIVIQLRDNVDVAMSQDGGKIRLTIPNEASPNQAQAEKANGNAGAETAAVPNKAGSPAAPATEDEMDRVLKGINSKEFSGKPITLQVRDLDVRDVFNLIAETSGFNIVLAPDVQGQITLSLVDVPWDQALDVVMQTMKLGADRKGNVLRVMTLDGLAKEIDLQERLKVATEAVEPRKTEVFPISYAKLTDLAATISKLIGIEFATPSGTGVAQALGGTGAAAAANQASANKKTDVKVIPDERTNSLIIWAIPSVMERIRKIIAVLDTQTPQIMLEGKVIEAKESYSRTLNGSLGLTNLGLSGTVPYGGSINNNNLLSSPAGLIGALPTTLAAPGAAFATQIIPFSQQINATLNIGEAEDKLKTIASPKEVVLNKQEAKIIQGTPVFVPMNGIGPAGGIVSTGTVVNANLSLDVTPTVTGDGSVLMDVNLSRDLPEALQGASTQGQEGVGNNNITTHVLVDSGSTLVLGGFFSSTNDHINSGLPFFRDIPIIGFLFSSDSKTDERDELFFFITPTIVNPKKAGIQKS